MGLSTGTTYQSEPGSNNNKRNTPYYPKVHDWSLAIRCRSVPYLVHSLLAGSPISAGLQSAYSTASADRTIYT